MLDALSDDGGLRIDPLAIVRLRDTGKAMLADIDRCGRPAPDERSNEGGPGRLTADAG